MSRTFVRVVGVLLALALVGAGCADDSDEGAETTDDGGETTEEIDYEALGLWDDGPCDESLDPLVIGLTTTFETSSISLGDQATALEASAEAFNQRGGANGACIEVQTCDDGGTLDKAVACADQFIEGGVMATINDQGTAGQAEVSEALATAGIPRLAGNVSNLDWADQNAYPLDASGTGTTFLMPQALINVDAKEIGIIRVDGAAASAIKDILGAAFEDDGATFVYDAGVPGGTTDFTQFIQGAEAAGATGVMIALGEQEAVQVVGAGQQLATELLIGGSLGTFSHSAIAEMGDFAQQMVFTAPFAPATADVPVYEALLDDFAASGEEALQVENLKTSPMRSWIGLYALLKMIRDAELTELSAASIKTLAEEAQDVPMLDMFGGEDWTPDTDHEGVFVRAGMNHWATYQWDPEAEDFVEVSEMNWDEVVCGSIFGAPPETC